ncbi:MAG: hypothetical protein ACKO0M_18580 [Cyanobium sp.]
MLIYACISGHGFGHGSRTASVLCELATRRPDVRLVLSTTLPEAFLRLALGAVSFELRPCSWDVGMVQADALDVDAQATLAALERLDRELEGRLAEEVEWLRRQREPLLVLGDVPPPAARIAAALDAPLVWLASFGWDAIYAPQGGELAARAEECRRAYACGTLLLRCPLSLPMEWGIPFEALGLTCSRPRLDLQWLSDQLQLPFDRNRCVLISFGGLGLEVDPALLQRWPDHVFLGSDPALAASANGRVLPEGVRPLDVMPLVGRLITKAGYSTFCEAFSQDVGIHLVERRGFAEAPVLSEALQDHGLHRLLSRDQLGAGDWQLDQPLMKPRVGTLPGDGSHQAAQALLALAPD